MRLSLFLALFLVAACGAAPDEEDPTPKCDLTLQAGEDGVLDGPFDADGDGFVDGDNPDCAAVYTLVDCDDDNPDIRPQLSEVLCNDIDEDCSAATPDAPDADQDGDPSCTDCNDNDPLAWNGNTEVCWDLVDNDCNGVVDDACGPDYNGTFTVTPAPSYQCAFQTVSIDFSKVTFIYNPPIVTIFQAGGTAPGSMDGEITATGDFEVYREVLLGTAAACDETYTFIGAFTDGDHFTGTLTATYGGGICLNCNNQEWVLEGVREP